MNPSALFVHRPVMTLLLTAAAVIFGGLAYRQLPVSDLPNVDFPVITVTASYPGADPNLMAVNIATPLEKQLAQISGVQSMLSTSMQGSTSISLTFDLQRNIDGAASDVQAALSRAAKALPPDMIVPPSYAKINPANQPTLWIALTSETLTPGQLYDYGNTLVAQPISMIPGVSTVGVKGAKSAIRIALDPRAMASRGLGLAEVVAALQSNNSNRPVGQLDGEVRTLILQADGQMLSPEKYNQTILRYEEGRPVFLQDIGQAFLGLQQKNFRFLLTEEGKISPPSALLFSVVKAPGANEVEMAQAVKQLLPKMEKDLPGSVEMKIIYDRSQQIVESVNDVKQTLVLAFFLVVAVIFLFLGRVTDTIVPAVSIPVTFVLTFIAMYLAGFSLDNLSLMALTLGVGFVVDDAIVVLENTVRLMEKGKSSLEAALQGAGEIGFTVLSMTLSLSAVFIPLVFMTGMLGRVFREFSLTIIIAILASGLVSLILTPLMCARLLKNRATQKTGRLETLTTGWVDRILRGYSASLRWVLQRRIWMVVAWIACFGGVLVLFRMLPKTFLPTGDSGVLQGIFLMEQGASPKALEEYGAQIAAKLRTNSSIQSASVISGLSGGALSNEGFLMIRLKPHNERPAIETVIKELNREMEVFPQGMVILRAQPTLVLPTTGGLDTDADYVFTLQGLHQDEVNTASQALAAKMAKLPALRKVHSNLQFKTPQLKIAIDRGRVSTLGLSAYEVEQALSLAYADTQISTIQTSVDQYSVIASLQDPFRGDPRVLSWLYLSPQASKSPVPLSAVITSSESVGPSAIYHTQQFPSVSIAFNLAPGTTIDQATAEVEKLAAETLPPSVSGKFQGDAAAFEATMANLIWLTAAAILVMYLVLGILYESFIHPLTVLSTLPIACFGGLGTLLLFQSELSLYAFIGIFMLMGIVKKNGIMMVDFAVGEQKNGQAPLDAITAACVQRFRPITMTGLAAIMGALPVALGWGADGASRQPLGLCVVGGLIFSQVITLYITPALYLYFDQLQSRLGREGKPEDAKAVPLPQG